MALDPAKLNARGCERLALGDFSGARALFEQCVDAAPDNPVGLFNLGTAYRKLGLLEPSLSVFERALVLRPNFPQATFNLGLSLLGLGRWTEGWPHFEARFEALGVAAPTVPFPLWRGEALEGRSILIHHDQGLGDEIQLFRYVHALRAMGARIGWLAMPSLADMFKANRADVDIYVRGDAVPRHDVWLPTCSLPGRLQTTPDTVPLSAGYISATPPPSRGQFRVGFVWKGNPKHKNDRNRSLPGPESLVPLNTVPGVQLVSLQTDSGDWTQTVQAVAAVDLVVSVDTSTAHLAGAMGKPTWLLLPHHETDWRWLQHRDDSPWYSSMTLFRQDETGWAPTISAVVERLGERMSK